jgi:hypothetical protein
MASTLVPPGGLAEPSLSWERL